VRVDLTERTFDAVLFDNDGTLVDSTAAVSRAWARWAEEHGVRLDSLDDWHGVPAAAIIAQIAPELDQAAALARIVDIEVADVTDVAILPGARQALEAVGDRAAIATSGTRDLALARLGAVGIVVPASLVTADDVRRGKPDPEPYLLAAARVGADPARCLVVEDAPSGLASARAAGCATIAVTTTYAAEVLDADLVVGDLSQVRFLSTDDGITVSLVGADVDA